MWRSQHSFSVSVSPSPSLTGSHTEKKKTYTHAQTQTKCSVRQENVINCVCMVCIKVLWFGTSQLLFLLFHICFFLLRLIRHFILFLFDICFSLSHLFFVCRLLAIFHVLKHHLTERIRIRCPFQFVDLVVVFSSHRNNQPTHLYLSL